MHTSLKGVIVIGGPTTGTAMFTFPTVDIRHAAASMFFFNRSTLQRDDILTNQLAANTHVIARETQIFQCAAIN